MSESAYPGQTPNQQQPAQSQQPAQFQQPVQSQQPAQFQQPVQSQQPAQVYRPSQIIPPTRPATSANQAGAYQAAQPASVPQSAQPTGGYQSSQPAGTYQAAQAAPQYQRPMAQSQVVAQNQSALQGGLLKTFLVAFIGALLGALLILGVTGNLFPSTAQSTAIGGNAEGAAITVQGDDAVLAEAVAAKTLPSVVCIYVYSEQMNYGWFGAAGTTEETLSSLGSGVILSEDGYVLTNAHVIEGQSSLKVSVNDTQYDAVVVGTDATSDLAVIKIEGAEGLVPIEIGNSGDLKVGQWVMTVGSPYGMEQSVATGIVSAVSRSSSSLQTADSTAIYANLIQTDAAINPGNSGGALVDSQGRLIGINTLVASYSGSYSGVGFAIPVDYAYSIATQIINGEEPSHAQLGVSLINVDEATAERYGLSASSGAYVAQVFAGAADAGIQEGDIITKIDGKTMSSATDVILAVRSHMPGDTLNVEVNRNGETVSMDVLLTSDNME